jgi:AAA domain/RepB DNA-primase from phage plasmid
MNRCAENHHINNSTGEDAKFDRDAISAHFCHLHHVAARADIPGGKMVLAVYGEDPDTKENFASVRHFEIGDHDGMTAAAMEFDGVPHRNVYAPVVVLKPDTAPGTRKEEDIAAVLGFVIDADADKGKDAPTPPLPPDYVIESSTGNLQHFLWLDRPLPHEEAKQFGLALKRATGADSANDIGHVWRVPGALNWPNAVKVHDPKGRRGRKRSRDAQPVLVHQQWSKWTSVTALRDALAPHWGKPRTEITAVISSLDAPKFDYDRVARWIDRKVAGPWSDDPTSLSQEDWALLGKAIKISFPGEDGLELWLRLSHDPDKAVKRWNDPRDFKSEYTEGMRTLRWYFDKDTDWMFGDVEDMLNGKLIQSPPLAPVDPIPAGWPLPGPWQGEGPSDATPSAPVPDLLVSSAEFIGGFVPPEYLIDGIVQRRYFYSMTAQTGVGKTSIAMRWMAHVVTGRPIGEKEVQQGSVLYFAGENPDDVRARWLVLTRDMGIDPATKDVHWIVGAKDLNAAAQQISAEVTAKGLNLAYVVIDTAAAYNVGDDENSNTQAGNYARQLRSLTNLPGGPCVVVLCHPTKRAADDDLLPRGGGAFLAEVDGNMAVQKRDSLLAVSPQGKYRGDTSWVLRYELEVIRDHPVLKDVRGRPIASVVARPVGEGAAAVLEKRTDADMETVLAAVDRTPSATPTDLARSLGWTFGPKAEPNVNRVKRNLVRLGKDKLVKETLGKWRTTPVGEKELNAIDTARATTPKPMFPLPATFGLPQ